MPKKLIDPRSSITEETSRRIANALEYIAIADAKDIDITDYQQIANIVKAGRAKDFFEIGDQIHTTWKQDDNHEYNMPWDVVDFGPCEDPDGNVHENAMWLQSHYVLPTMQYDQGEAFYVAPDEMPAGTYHFAFSLPLTSKITQFLPYMFTITNTIPAGGQLVFGDETSDSYSALRKDITNWRVRVYSSGEQSNPNEIATISQGEEGSNLGILRHEVYKDSGLNDIYRTSGYNRWSQSSLRQWLNSDKPTNEWWKPQNPYDRSPHILSTMRGFEAGLSDSFLAIAKPIKIKTILDDTAAIKFGESETTVDRFFAASSGQEFTEPIDENEGRTFAYWKNILGEVHMMNGVKRNDHIRYNIGVTSSKSSVWFRTPRKSSSMVVTAVESNGRWANRSASLETLGSCPCCVIY